MTLLYTPLPARGVLAVGGDDRESFLQGLVTNDARKLGTQPAVYAAMLSPQGKLLFDFLMVADGECILLDCEGKRLPELLKKLSLYKLRSKVTLADLSETLGVHALWGGDMPAMPGLFADPRALSLGYRLIAPRDADLAALGTEASFADYEALRILAGVPDGGRDMPVEKALIMDYGFEALGGVDFQKGCYVGQEVTARMKYRSTVRKALFPVKADGPLPVSGSPVMAGEKEVGEIRSGIVHPEHGTLALAHLRLEAVEGSPADQPLLAAGVKLHRFI